MQGSDVRAERQAEVGVAEPLRTCLTSLPPANSSDAQTWRRCGSRRPTVGCGLQHTQPDVRNPADPCRRRPLARQARPARGVSEPGQCQALAGWLISTEGLVSAHRAPAPARPVRTRRSVRSAVLPLRLPLQQPLTVPNRRRPPKRTVSSAFPQALWGTRTPDPFLTMEVLYRLS